MSIQEIEKAITELKPSEIAVLADWFVGFQEEQWDKQIEMDISNGKFDTMISETVQDYKYGRIHEL